MYEICCLYTFIYALTEINRGLKRYGPALAWHSSAKNKNQILDSVGRKRAAMPHSSVVYMQLYTEVFFRKDSLTELQDNTLYIEMAGIRFYCIWCIPSYLCTILVLSGLPSSAARYAETIYCEAERYGRWLS